MNNSLLNEILISIALVVLLILFLNPFDFWMPNKILMLMILILIVVFSIFASFIWREDAKDERQTLHKMIAGRFAFLVGSAVLVIGVVFQSFEHKVDIWLILALGLMILAKIIGLIYGRFKY